MTGGNDLVRRRVNGWYIDEMLEMCEKNATGDKPGWLSPESLTMITQTFRVISNQQTDEEDPIWFDADKSNLICPSAVPDANQKTHPTLVDVFFGQFSFEQFLAMKLAQSIITNPRHKTTLKELVGLHNRTPDLQGLLDSFLAPDSIRKYYGTMIKPEQRAQYVLVIELILFAMMGYTMSDAGGSTYLPICKKIIDKLDRCFRDDWVFCKNIYTSETRAICEDESLDDDAFVGKFLYCLERLSFATMVDEYADIAEISCIRFFMMTRKLPVSSLDDSRKPQYAGIFWSLMETMYHEYSVFISSQFGLKLSRDKKNDCAVLEDVAKTWHRVQNEITNPKLVCDFHIPSLQKPISPPYAARSLLSSHGISFCRLSSLFGENACYSAVRKSFLASIEQAIPPGEKLSITDAFAEYEKGTPDDIYYLGVIEMLARAYADAMQIGPDESCDSKCDDEESGIDAEQLGVSFSLAEENKKLRAQIDLLNMELRLAKTETPDIESMVSERVAAEVEAYKKEKDTQLQVKLQKKDERITRLETRVEEAMTAAFRSMKGDESSSKDAPSEKTTRLSEPERRLSEEDFSAIEETLADQKVYVFGGHADWRKKMKSAFPYIPIIPTDSYVKYGDALANADIIIINAFHCSHKASNSIVDTAKKSNTRLIYVEKEKNPHGVGQLLIKALGLVTTKAR